MANILDGLGTFHILSKFCGFTVFTVNHKDLSVKITCYDFCFYIFTMSFNVIMCYNSVVVFMKAPVKQSRIVDFTLPILVIITVFVEAGISLSHFFLRFKIVEIFKNFIAIDLKVCIETDLY